MKTTKPKSLMKRLLTFTAVLGLAACVTGVASAQSPVLFNGNLNQITVADTPGNPPVGWTALGILTISFPSGGWLDCEASEPWCNGAADPNPAGYGIFIKAFEGTTNANPALDDLACMYFYQDNPSSSNTTYTLSAYVGGGGTYSGYQETNGISNNGLAPATALYVVFFNSSGGILQSNSYDLITAGLPTTGNLGGAAVPSTQYTTPVYTAPVGTVTVRAGLLMLNQWNPNTIPVNQPSLFADDFDLEATPPPGSPIVTNQPVAATVAPGATAQFNVGTSPAATTYQWTLNNSVLSDVAGHISGSGTATITITGATNSDVGHYQAIVSNASGLNRSAIVPLAINGINLFPSVTLVGTVGDTYQVNRSSSPSGPWSPLTLVKLTTSPQYIVDFTLPVSPAEFYQEVYEP